MPAPACSISGARAAPRGGEAPALPASRKAAGLGWCQAPRRRRPLPGQRRAPRHVLVPLLRAFTFFAALACVADFAGAAVGAIARQAVASAPAGAGEARVTGCGRCTRPSSISGAGWPNGHPAPIHPCPPHLSHSGSRRNPLGTRRGRSPRSSRIPLRFGKGLTHRHPLLEAGGGQWQGGPQHASSQLPQQDRHAAQGSAQAVWTPSPTQAPRQPYPLAGGGHLRKGVITDRHLVPCSLATEAVSAQPPKPQARRCDRQQVPRVTASHLAWCWSWTHPSAHSPASHHPRKGESLPVSHWVPTKPSGQ